MPAERTRNEKGGSREYILVAEPREQIRQALQETLDARFRVLAARTATGAVLGFEHHRPKVVLAAMEQDQGDGFELCRKMAALPGAGSSLLLVYGATPAEMPEYRERDVQRQYGVGRYISQGVTVKGLLDLAQEHMDSLGRRQPPCPDAESAAGTKARGKDEPQRWRSPFCADGVVSARKAEDEGTFSLRRLLRRRG